MQQNTKPILLIDARHTLYDSRQNRKYNSILAKSFQTLGSKFRLTVIFCHNKPALNQLSFDEFKKHFQGVDAKMISLNELQLLEYQDEDVVLITHDFKRFTIKSLYQLYYFSSLQQGFLKKQQLELQYYSENNEIFHISHIEQVKSYFDKCSSNFVVGYYFYPKKMNELIHYQLLTSNQNIRYLPVDFRFQNMKQSSMINVLFHKIMDIHKSKEINLKQEEVQLFQLNYNKFVNDYPNIAVLDRVDKMSILIQRDQLNDKLNAILSHGTQIKTPKQIVFDNTKPGQFVVPDQHYPIIVKSKQGALTHNCHIMAIVVNDAGLKSLLDVEQFKDNLIIQEIINHDSTIYKIYQLGSQMIVQKRRSIPNIQVENFKFDEGFHVFDTQKDLFTNVSACLKNVEQYNHVNEHLDCEKELYLQFEQLSKLISEEFNLQLFGFDIIGNNNADYYIIDINHFPGYKNVNCLITILLGRKNQGDF